MAGDPDWSSVVLLTALDGTNGSTTFVDETTRHSLFANGGAALSTAQKKFGTASLAVNGSNYVYTSDSADFNLGNDDFTIEAWIRPTTVPGSGIYPGIVAQRYLGSSGHGYGLYLNGDNGGRLRFDWTYDGSTTVSALAGLTAAAAATWSHAAVVRTGGFITVYLNGVGGTPTSVGTSSIYNSTYPLTIGILSSGGGSTNFTGYIDEVRISKGVARYTANFTPPTAAFPIGSDEVPISGIVRDDAGAFAARQVYLYRRDTGGFVGAATSSAVDGTFSIMAAGSIPSLFAVALDDSGGTDYNALILDRIVPPV